MNLKWRQIKFAINSIKIRTGKKVILDDGTEEEVVLTDFRRVDEMTVTGKTGTRQIIVRTPTIRMLDRIARRIYGVKNSIFDPLRGMSAPTNEDFVLRTKQKKQDVSSAFQHMLERYLEEHNLPFDPKTDQNRVFYRFRHIYATVALTHDKVPIHTLAKQVGTSTPMIDRLYSHLKVIEAVEQLGGEETRRRIASMATAEEIYQSSIKKRAVQISKKSRNKTLKIKIMNHVACR